MLNAAHSGKGWIILVKELCGTASLWEWMIMQEGGKRKKKLIIFGKFLSPDLTGVSVFTSICPDEYFNNKPVNSSVACVMQHTS